VNRYYLDGLAIGLDHSFRMSGATRPFFVDVFGELNEAAHAVAPSPLEQTIDIGQRSDGLVSATAHDYRAYPQPFDRFSKLRDFSEACRRELQSSHAR
jgi:hypothetical protein